MENKEVEKKYKRDRRILLLITLVLAIVILAAVIALVFSNWRTDSLLGREIGDFGVYDRHYALILQNPSEEICKEIKEGCKEKGETTGSYVELFGGNLEGEYSREELLEIAIASNVDGIIVEGGENSQLKEWINLAAESGIPVVTVLSDCIGSSRKSYVGVGGYDLGREYGRQIIKIATKETRQVLVLLDSNADDSTQNIICNGIRETLTNEGNHLRLELVINAVDSTSSFSADESIRNLLTNMTNLPDIIICLNEQNTMSVYQAVVDYNIVGEVSILGYYTSDSILEAIQKNILSSTICIDFQDMGIKCVDALNEYVETQHVNGYFQVEANTVNGSNVKEYLNDDSINQ